MRRAVAAPADAILGRITAALIEQHPDFIRRLDKPAAFLVVPSDLPFRFLVTTGPAGLSLRIVLPGEAVGTTTRISAPLATLVALAECRMDADAIFFDRTLTIDGDIEPVLAIRNAIESESIRIADTVASALGPLAVPARWADAAAREALHLAASAFRSVRSGLLAPVLDRLDALERAVNRSESAAGGHHPRAQSHPRRGS